MWWMPLITLGMNKMAEKKAKEDLQQQQTHAIRSDIARKFGSPGYGEQTARAMYDSQRQIDAQRRARNQQMLQGVFDGMGEGEAEGGDGTGTDGYFAYPGQGFDNYKAVQKNFGAHGDYSTPPAPDEPMSAFEKSETEKARNALRRLG